MGADNQCLAGLLSSTNGELCSVHGFKCPAVVVGLDDQSTWFPELNPPTQTK